VGEIERGEANTTLDALERLADAVGWDPMDALDGMREPITEGVRVMLLSEVSQLQDRLTSMTKWLAALDPALDQDPKKRSRARARRAQKVVAARKETR